MSEIKGTGVAKYKCSKCGHQDQIEMSDLSFDIVEVQERSMGKEVHYQADAQFDCSKCKNEIELTFEVWEYPNGQINAKDKSASGAELLSDFDVGGLGITLSDER